MRSLLLALLCIAAASATEYVIEDGVYVLTDENFGRAMNEFEYALVTFYIPWISHCQAFLPEFAKAAQRLATTHPNVRLCKVNAETSITLMEQFSASHYPSIKFFMKGSSQPLTFKAGRDADIIYHWVIKKTGAFSVEVKTLEEAEKQIEDNQVLAFFLGSLDSEALTAFIDTASTFDDFGFAHTTESSVKQKYGVEGETLILFKKFDEGKNIFTGPFNAPNITDFLNYNRFPLIQPFDSKVAGRIFAEGRDAIFLVRANDEAGDRAEAALITASQSLKGKILISTAKWEDPLGQKLSDYIGVTKDSLPAIRISQPEPLMRKFFFNKEITPENIIAFVDNYIEGKLTAIYNSQEIPEDPYEDNVRVVVGKNWKNIVLDPTNDVLIMYYAPGCDNCKALASIFSEVGKKVKDVQGLVIAKMDMDANEVEGAHIDTLPSIKFYSTKKKFKPVEYTAAKTEAAILNFLSVRSSANFANVKVPLLIDNEL